MIPKTRAEQLLQALKLSQNRGRALRKEAMIAISSLAGYNWSGIYRLEGDMLVLDEYVGASTDHTHIPVGRGVCGTAVAEGKNQIVSDVRELSNYLSCSLETRSEIVVLIKRGEIILGQIDIDGHTVGSFQTEDERFLEEVAEVLAASWEE